MSNFKSTDGFMGRAEMISTALGNVEVLDWSPGRVAEGALPVLAIHGAMGGYDQSWCLAATVGPNDRRYLCVSRPGYLGTPLGSCSTPALQADLHAALLDSLGIPKVDIMAISGGGPSALEFALRHPDRLGRLMLFSTITTPMKSRIPMSFHLLTLMARVPFITRRLKMKAENNLEMMMASSITDPQILRETLANEETMKLFRVILLDMYDRMGERLKGTATDIRISRSFNPEIEGITASTLVVHGVMDSLATFQDQGRLLAERIPGAISCFIDRGEHVTIFTHREIVRRKVDEFMNT